MIKASIGIIGECLVVALQGFTGAFNALPLSWRDRIVSVLISIFLLIKPRYRKLALEQISLSFPERDARWHADIEARSWRVLARAITDFLRGPSVTPAWIEDHVVVSGLESVLAYADRSDKPFLLCSGHIGSFDLLAHVVGKLVGQMEVVVRDAKSPIISEWWRRLREGSGNGTISRKGAVRGMLQAIAKKRHIGILFDQNVTADVAVFVPWFGRLAATTSGLGAVAVRTESPIVICALHWLGGDRYQCSFELLPVSDLYQSEMSKESKILEITQRSSTALEQLIRKHPEQWFWMHRRWRTSPPTTHSVTQSA